MQYVNTCPTIPDPITVDPVCDSEEDIWSHAAFPEMVPNFASPPDIPESSNFSEHQTDNFEANRFFNLLYSSSKPAYEGCSTETELSINMKMLATKANYGLSEGAYNASKKLVADLGMGYQRIDVCVGGCMIYYGCDESMTVCRFYSEPRYLIQDAQKVLHRTNEMREVRCFTYRLYRD
ncbi:unnamed protein product [Rhodiola kirilowii]